MHLGHRSLTESSLQIANTGPHQSTVSLVSGWRARSVETNSVGEPEPLLTTTVTWLRLSVGGSLFFMFLR